MRSERLEWRIEIYLRTRTKRDILLLSVLLLFELYIYMNCIRVLKGMQCCRVSE